MTDSTAKPEFVSGVPLVVITGLSGAGKSTAMRFLEDLGCYCLDNLPPTLIPEIFNLYEQSTTGDKGIVVACDVRSGDLFEDFTDTISSLKKAAVDFKILYLDCSRETLVKRFGEVRRRHPLQTGQTMKAAIDEERTRLEPIRKIATCVVDTSSLDAAGLREQLIDNLVVKESSDMVQLRFLSFGFKYGLPRDADFVFDVRFLKNPHYDKDLKILTGNDQPVYDYVMSDPLSSKFMDKITDLLELSLEPFLKVGKTTITIGIGCTGGRHRSVTIARALTDRFGYTGRKSRAIHRDATKPVG